MQDRRAVQLAFELLQRLQPRRQSLTDQAFVGVELWRTATASGETSLASSRPRIARRRCALGGSFFN